MNTIGTLYRLTTFGESHGPAVGGIIDGIPSGKVIDMTALRNKVAARRPGRNPAVTTRNEQDAIRFLSGLLSCDSSGKKLTPFSDDSPFAITLGTPIGFMTENTDSRSADYDALADVYRPSHADYTWHMRYGIRDHRGGGRASGRETFSRVVAGAFALQLLNERGITVNTRIARLGDKAYPDPEETAAIIASVREKHDSIGGIVECCVSGLPAGIGEPTFGKLHQMLGNAILSIGAVKGVEFGMGFEGCCSHGSDVVDEMEMSPEGNVRFLSNYSGGVQGGISNGEPITMRIAVKPTPTIAHPLRTINVSQESTILSSKGRHDPSVLPRILPVIETMTAINILDALLLRSASI